MFACSPGKVTQQWKESLGSGRSPGCSDRPTPSSVSSMTYKAEATLTRGCVLEPWNLLDFKGLLHRPGVSLSAGELRWAIHTCLAQGFK